MNYFLNDILISYFPNMKDSFLKEKEINNDENVDPYDFCLDYFNPYIINCLKEKDDISIYKLNKLLNYLFSLNDEYCTNFAITTIVEGIIFNVHDVSYFLNFIDGVAKTKILETINYYKEVDKKSI